MMPPYFVMGHGSRIDDSKTFVPAGTRVRFYSEVDVNLADTVALLAVADGAKAPAVETVEGSGEETVFNYEVTEDGDGEAEDIYAQWVAMGAKNAGFINWVGKATEGQPALASGLKLCANRDGCRGKATHECVGLLGLLKEQHDIVLLICRQKKESEKEKEARKKRGEPTPEVKTVVTYGTDKSHPLYDRRQKDVDLEKHIHSLVTSGDLNELAKAETMVFGGPGNQPGGIEDKDLALLINRSWFRNWEKAYQLKKLAERAPRESKLSPFKRHDRPGSPKGTPDEGKYDDLLNHLRVNFVDIEAILDIVKEVPSYNQAVVEALNNPLCQLVAGYRGSEGEELLELLAELMPGLKIGGGTVAVTATDSRPAPRSSPASSADRDEIILQEGEVEYIDESEASEEASEDDLLANIRLVSDDEDDRRATESDQDEVFIEEYDLSADQEAAVRRSNTSAVADLKSGQSTRMAVRGNILLIGDDHPGSVLEWVRKGSDGALEAPKGAFSNSLRIASKISPEYQELVRGAVKAAGFQGEVRFSS